MRLPVIQGVIRRRILVNFRVDPAVMQVQLPSRFRPKLQGGHAIAGICLIRLESVRPRFVPPLLGLSSENAAHRIAVRWRADGAEKEGVFIPRRDTGSAMNHLARRPALSRRASPRAFHRAGKLRHHRPQHAVRRPHGLGEGPRSAWRDLPGSSCFSSLAEASAFFEPGSLGYSVTSDAGRLDGIELKTHGWSVEPFRSNRFIPAISQTRPDSRKEASPSTALLSCAMWGTNGTLLRMLSSETGPATTTFTPGGRLHDRQAAGWTFESCRLASTHSTGRLEGHAYGQPRFSPPAHLRQRD